MNSPSHNGKATSEDLMESEVLVVQVGTAHGLKKPGSNGRPIRVVVADESPMVLKTLCSFLNEQGDVQIVGAATDGHQALRRVQELEPDLLLINSRLYRTEGLEATCQLKERAHVPAVIIVTAEDTSACHAAVRTACIDGFVAQQQTFTHLLAAIRRLLPRAMH